MTPTETPQKVTSGVDRRSGHAARRGRLRTGVLCLAAFAASLVVGCARDPVPEERTPAAGDYRVELLGGGGSSRTSARAVERVFQGPWGSTANPGLDVDFTIATDGAVWAAVGSPDIDYAQHNAPKRKLPDSLVRIDRDGSVRDVDFRFVEPAHIDGGSAGDEVAVVSGPVSDGSGGVVVVAAPEPDILGWTELSWAKLYRVDAQGEVTLLDVPEGYQAAGVGPSAAGGFVLHAASTTKGCARFFTSVDGTAWDPVLGVDCGPDHLPDGALTLTALEGGTIDPDSVSIYETNSGWIRAGLLPDGRVMVAESGVGLFVEQPGSGITAVITGRDGADKEDGGADGVEWSDLTASKPFESFGVLSDLQISVSRFTLSSHGGVSLQLAAAETPLMSSRAFHFDVHDAPSDNGAQKAANEGIRASGAPESGEGLVRGSGIAMFDLMNGDPNAEVPVSLVSGYGNLCDWRGEDELVCAMVGWHRQPDSSESTPVPSAMFVSIPIP